MIQRESRLLVADNSGAKIVLVIGALGGGIRCSRLKVGDVVIVSVKEVSSSGGKVKKKEVHKAVIIRTKKKIVRKNGMVVRFDNNACVLINKEGDPIGTRIFGSVSKELRSKKFSKIISLAPEVV